MNTSGRIHTAFHQPPSLIVAEQVGEMWKSTNRYATNTKVQTTTR
jgi:hypothetical protein